MGAALKLNSWEGSTLPEASLLYTRKWYTVPAVNPERVTEWPVVFIVALTGLQVP